MRRTSAGVDPSRRNGDPSRRSVAGRRRRRESLIFPAPSSLVHQALEAGGDDAPGSPLAEAQVRFPSVPIVFCESRQLTQEWTYRFLGAAVAEVATEGAATELVEQLSQAGPVPPPEPTTAEVRAWATAAGLPVKSRGRLAPEVWAAYRAAHQR